MSFGGAPGKDFAIRHSDPRWPGTKDVSAAGQPPWYADVFIAGFHAKRVFAFDVEQLKVRMMLWMANSLQVTP